MKLKEIETIFSWSANSAVNVPILFALFGFIYSITVFNSGWDNVNFQGVYLSNKDSLSSIVVNNRIEILTKYIDTSAKYQIPKNNDELQYRNTQFNRSKIILTASQKELKNISNGDSSIKNFIEYANINKDKLRQSITLITEDTTNQESWAIPFFIKDTCTFPNDSLFKEKKIDLILKKSEISLIDFFSINSRFGYWFFLSIGQMCLWFAIIPLVIGSVKKIDAIALQLKFKYTPIFAIIPTIFVALFAYLVYNIIIDKYVIGDILVMKAFNTKMIWFGIIGYIVAILCFSSYLYLSNTLEILNSQPFARYNEKSDIHLKLTKAFNFSFLCSAIVLTVFVLWIDILFNAINNTELMQFYKLKTGSNFLNNDFVYLIGLMHSLLLLIFYIPTKIRFSSLETSQEEKRNDIANLSTGAKIWKNTLEMISTIIVTTSPLIGPLIQKILEAISS